jgi:hypothetical protein
VLSKRAVLFAMAITPGKWFEKCYTLSKICWNVATNETVLVQVYCQGSVFESGRLLSVEI